MKGCTFAYLCTSVARISVVDRSGWRRIYFPEGMPPLYIGFLFSEAPCFQYNCPLIVCCNSSDLARCPSSTTVRYSNPDVANPTCALDTTLLLPAIFLAAFPCLSYSTDRPPFLFRSGCLSYSPASTSVVRPQEAENCLRREISECATESGA